MKPVNDYITTVYPLLEDILYSITLYKTISGRIKQDASYDPYEREFWVDIMNNSIQMAIINWCKVFGSENQNPFHYSNHFEFVLEGIEQSKAKMVKFRNKYIAHKTEVEVSVPYLNEALAVIFAFDKILREEYDLHSYPTMKETLESNQLRIEDILMRYGLSEI